ncbi:hypothetical protein [Nonomuraea sp. NPDC050691]|uniref:hypothetical protein n=1 Tax=Nonomuraea sp. NPDC050691 TaxID=3155661 RepID=UPI0033EECE54
MPVLTSRARIRLAASAAALTLAGFAPLGASSAARASVDVVDYTCTGASVPAQTVRIRVTLTMPTSAVVGEQFSIMWSGTYETGSELKAPSTGLPAGLNLYPHAGISGLPQLTSATGTGSLGALTPGQALTLPTSVAMKATARSAGTGSVRPGAINIGTAENTPLIECTPTSTGQLSAYTLTVAAGGTDPDPDSSPSDDTSEDETPSADSSDTSDASEDETESTRERSSVVPKAGAETGGGGEAGPDGRALLLGGSALIVAAGIGGLLTRRPRRG